MEEIISTQETTEQQESTEQQQAPTEGQQPPTPPTFGEGEQPTFGEGQQPPRPPMPPMFGQSFMPPPDMSMWGNNEFANQEMFNGEKFSVPNDLGEITDVGGADIDLTLGQENFGDNGFMPPAFGGFGGQGFNPPQQAAQESQAE